MLRCTQIPFKISLFAKFPYITILLNFSTRAAKNCRILQIRYFEVHKEHWIRSTAFMIEKKKNKNAMIKKLKSYKKKCTKAHKSLEHKLIA